MKSLFLDKAIWSKVLAEIANDTDHDNFKSKVASHHGWAVAAYKHSLNEVW